MANQRKLQNREADQAGHQVVRGRQIQRFLSELIFSLCDLCGVVGQQRKFSMQVSTEAMKQRGKREQKRNKIAKVSLGSGSEIENGKAKGEVIEEKLSRRGLSSS